VVVVVVVLDDVVVVMDEDFVNFKTVFSSSTFDTASEGVADVVVVGPGI